MKNVFIAAIAAGIMALSVGCESKSDMGGTTGGSSSGSGKGTKKSANGEGLGNSQADDGTAPKTDTPPADTPAVDPNANTTPATTPATTTTTTTTAPVNKYPNYREPTEAEKKQMADDGYAQVFNKTNAGIVSANGQQLPQVIPPGKTLYAPKSFDFNEEDDTTLSVTLDNGQTAQNSFRAGNVAQMQWKAIIQKDASGNLTITESAGGGGGGGGGAGFK